MQGMRDPPFHRVPRGAQRLRHDLSAEEPPTPAIFVPAAKEIPLDPFELEDLKEVVGGAAHEARDSNTMPLPTFRGKT